VGTAATPSTSSSEGEVTVLGIESTAHTFGVGLARLDRSGIHLLRDSRRTYVPRKGGIVPREVAQFFSEVAAEVIEEALSINGVSVREVGAVAVALGPGMGPQLRVGATVARAIASRFNVPLVPGNLEFRRVLFRSPRCGPPRGGEVHDRPARPSDPLRLRRQHCGDDLC